MENARQAVENFSAGRLKSHLAYWRSLTSDWNILSAISGVHLEFVDEVPPTRHDCVPYRFDETKTAAIQAELDLMLKKGIIERTVREPQQFVSPIFTRDKKDGGLRIILDLSDLNESIQYHHFKMDTFETALTLVSKDCYMASIDWKDAYYTVPVAASDRKFLKFRWEHDLTNLLHCLMAYLPPPDFSPRSLKSYSLI